MTTQHPWRADRAVWANGRQLRESQLPMPEGRMTGMSVVMSAALLISLLRAAKRLRFVCKKATVGIEPTHEGFADPCLTTWPRRR